MRLASPIHNLQVNNPELAKEWHPNKNNDLIPSQVTPRSHKKVWWICSKGHEWESDIANRAVGNGCPYCSGRKPTLEKSIVQVNPNLAKEWHPNKNLKMLVSEAMPWSSKRAWWLCKKGHEWQATIVKRHRGDGCPQCSRSRVSADYSLEKERPELINEWHPTKNGLLTLADVAPQSKKRIWWACNKGHEWEATAQSRHKGTGCPYCENLKVNNENCLASTNPDVSNEWNLERNYPLTSKDVVPGSPRNVWWKCDFGHEWKMKIRVRVSGVKCPYCSKRTACSDNNLIITHPNLAKEWHPTKNGASLPQNVTCRSIKKFWWKCRRAHEWEARVRDRKENSRCPLCHSKTSVPELKIFSELKYIFNDASHRTKVFGVECDIYLPHLRIGIEVDGSYWHQNKTLKDQKKTEQLVKHKILLIRIRDEGLDKLEETDIIYPFRSIKFDLIKQIINLIQFHVPNFDDLENERINKYLEEEKFRNEEYFFHLLNLLPSPIPGSSLFDVNESLCNEWHPTKNSNLTPKDVFPGSEKKVWWICKKGHEWAANIGNRHRLGVGCPYCSGNKK